MNLSIKSLILRVSIEWTQAGEPPEMTLEEINAEIAMARAERSIERNLTDSMKELLDTGIICFTFFS